MMSSIWLYITIFTSFIFASLANSNIQCEEWGKTLKCTNRAIGNLIDLYNDEISELDFADCNLRFLDPTWLKQFPKLSKIHLNGNQLDCSCYARRKICAFIDKGVRLFGHCGHPKEIAGYALNNITKCESEISRRSVKDDNTLDRYADYIDIEVNKGTHAVLNCTINISSLENLLWTKDNNLLNYDNRINSFGNQLYINSVRFSDYGKYECIDGLNLNKTYSRLQLNVFGKPEVSFNSKVYFPYSGTHFEILCNIQGYPKPTIHWEKDGNHVDNSRIVITENSSKLLFDKLEKRTDNGQYKCTAQNNYGSSSAICEIQAIDVVPPTFLQKPVNNIISYVSGSVTICCHISGSPMPQVKWYFKGNEISFYHRYSLNSDKCLTIRNLTMLDIGQYKCSVSNIGGHLHHQLELDILDPLKTVPADFIRLLRKKSIIENNNITLSTIQYILTRQLSLTSVNEMAKLLRHSADEIKDFRNAEKLYHFIMTIVREHLEKVNDKSRYSSTRPEDMRPDCQTDSNGISALHIHRIAEMTGCFPHQLIPKSCHSKCLAYRTADGTCNNLANKMWGASQTPFARWMDAEYENGFNLPKGWNDNTLYNGHKLPSPRLISSNVIVAKHIHPDPVFTHMLMQWGQFIDHDITHTLMATGTHTFSDARLCTSSCTKESPCYPIKIPENDNRSKHRGNCIEFVRSTDVCLTGETSFLGIRPIERQQINQITSYMDASNVYGSTEQELHDVREHSYGKGLLRMRSDPRFPKRILPFAVDTPVDCQRDRDARASPVGCFLAGDHRASEQLGLTAMHTIWARQHNRLADKLSSLNPHWSSEQVFQESRKIVAAQMQHITYNDWLEHIIGEQLPSYRGYNDSINSQAANVIATSAFRFGHSIINPIVYRLNQSMHPIKEGNLLLRQVFFAPWRLLEEGGIDPLLRGMYAVPAKLKTPGQILNTELTEQLFNIIREINQDLAALNVQRGRDHGLPSYIKWRTYCNLSVPTDFSDLTKWSISDVNAISKLRKIYGDIRNIDVWVGGILEDNVQSGKVGELFKCLLKKQFMAIRDGDRFWYENEEQFSKDQLKEIKKTTLSKILCENGDDIKSIPRNVFYRSKYPRHYVPCFSIADLDLSPWKNCCADSIKDKNEVCNDPSIHSYDPLPSPRSYF